MTEPASVKIVEHGDASRLPDPRWLYRRLVIYAVTAVMLWAVWRVVDWLVDPSELKRAIDWPTVRLIVRYTFLTLWLVLTLYCVGATVTDVTKLIAAWKTTRRETTSTATAPAIITPGRVDAAEPEAEDPTEFGGPRG